MATVGDFRNYSLLPSSESKYLELVFARTHIHKFRPPDQRDDRLGDRMGKVWGAVAVCRVHEKNVRTDSKYVTCRMVRVT
jgi:hypothetical protein